MDNIDEDSSVFSGHYETDVQIDRPVGLVWNQFLDLSSWVTSHRIQLLAGGQATLGAITRVSPNIDELPLPRPHYHYCKIIVVVPERKYVLKTYSERGGSYGLQLACFDDFQFVALDRQTKVIMNLFVDYRGESVAKDPSAMRAGLNASLEGMKGNLRNLKRIVESRGN